jgi:crotonobetainyl-CoA:carnitine CoA-transferase CaiB-like acyl-CoA transferase
MPIAAQAIASLWSLAGGEASALAHVRLTNEALALPSSFHVTAAAQASIAAAGLAAAELWRARGGQVQTVTVDGRHAAHECRSERYLRVAGRPAPPTWDAIAGIYRTGDRRFVRLHTNFAHHRDAVLKVLGCEYKREAVQAALLQWKAEEFETAAYATGGVVALMRSPEEWAAHPQGHALSRHPALIIERIGDAPPRPLPAGAERPLSGVRVLDLTRVIAGPVSGRTLAAHGADVLIITGPHLPAIDWLVIDTGRGKRAAHIDLREETGRATLRRLIADADIFQQGYRPGAIGGRGFAPEEVARIRPGIVCVSLSAYGHEGPWSGRRGFDSLVQTATGFNHAEGRAAGGEEPKELPCQALDHASGYLMAFGAMMARLRQAREGGSWHVRVSLAGTGRWIWGLGRVEGGLGLRETRLEDVGDLIEESPSGFGSLRAVRHAAELSATPARWERPAMPLGSHPAAW